MRNRVLGLVYQNESDALTFASIGYCAALNASGYAAQVIDLNHPQGVKDLGDALLSGDVAFGFGLQGVGSRLTTLSSGINLWTATKVPFICLHHDHPCHNPFNHSSSSPYVANRYYFESFLNAKKRYLPSDQLSEVVPLTFLGIPHQSQIPFKERTFRFIYAKSGRSLDEENAELANLPKKLRDGVSEQLKRAQKSPNLNLCELVEDVFADIGIDHNQSHQQFWSVVKLMDLYVRRKRAIDMVEWLKLQEGALIIGDGWDFIDKASARADFKPTMNFAECVPLYQQTQFFLNTNPYGRDVLHERVINGLAYESCVITDTNAWWDQNFSDIPGLFKFNWDQPLEDQLRPVLDKADSMADAAAANRSVALERFPPSGIGPLLSFVDRVFAFVNTKHSD